MILKSCVLLKMRSFLYLNLSICNNCAYGSSTIQLPETLSNTSPFDNNLLCNLRSIETLLITIDTLSMGE
jgi:hypothetical protein